MADDVRALSAALARDPSGLVYVELAEALRRRGQVEDALRVVAHGLSRHPQHADGHDCLARIHVDRGDLAHAMAAWAHALEIAPEHVGALKGIGFLYFRQGEHRKALTALEHAVAAAPDDESVRRALETVRGASGRAAESGAAAPPVPPPPAAAAAPPQRPAAATAARPGAQVSAPLADRPPVFVGLEGATADIMMLDARGLVVAGGLRASDGSDASDIAAAALAGVSGEAGRTVSYLGVGAWVTIVAETEHANIVLAPVGDGALLMVRRDRSTPVGLALRIAERARAVAHRWLEGQGA